MSAHPFGGRRPLADRLELFRRGVAAIAGGAR